ncbi:MAG: molybdopterin adenylyltransferase, partial [Burkholderiales bacterium]|nr:molybdopterin adenylyltransferase [Burkholderiales bacterium]
MGSTNRPAIIGLVSVSDRASSGTYEDQGIPALKFWLSKVILSPYTIVDRLVPDDQDTIEKTLVSLCDDERCDLILTTGGTGPARRDVTPDATLAVCTREMPGFGEQMRAISLAFVPTAILSRQVGALRETGERNTLILNLPGQPKSIAETLEGLPQKGISGIFAAVPYCLELIGGPTIETDPQYIVAYRPKSAPRPNIIDAIIQEPKEKADCAIIVLHGLGADASDFEQLKEGLLREGAPLENARFILPNAPERAITMNMGYVMRGWYDLVNIDPNSKEDEKGIEESYEVLKRLIAEEETKGVPRNRIFLGGFSQGGSMAMYAAVRLHRPIGGFFCLSSYLPLMGEHESEHVGKAIASPIFVGYG